MSDVHLDASGLQSVLDRFLYNLECAWADQREKAALDERQAFIDRAAIAVIAAGWGAACSDGNSGPWDDEASAFEAYETAEALWAERERRRKK